MMVGWIAMVLVTAAVDSTAVPEAWAEQVGAGVRASWEAPYAYTLGVVSGATTIDVVLGRDGALVSMAVADSSGHAALHRASREAVRAAAPFEALPDSYPGDRVTVRLTLRYPPAGDDPGEPPAGRREGEGDAGGIAFRLSTYEWDWAPWMRVLEQGLRREWLAEGERGPPVAGRVRLRLTVAPDGGVSRAAVIESEGDAALYRLALAAAYAVEPLPPLPDPFPGEALTVEVTLAGALPRPEPVADRPRVTSLVKPVLPDSLPAAVRTLSGTVRVAAFVTWEGEVSELHVVDELHPDLDRTALDAVRRWRFAPREPAGETAGTWLVLRFRFHGDGTAGD